MMIYYNVDFDQSTITSTINDNPWNLMGNIVDEEDDYTKTISPSKQLGQWAIKT